MDPSPPAPGALPPHAAGITADEAMAAADAVTIAGVRAEWATAKPARVHYAEVVQHINTLRLVGDGRIFKRGPHVPAAHLGYFKPPQDAFVVKLRQKDRRSAKEWEYVNAAGVWLDMGLVAMEIAKEESGTQEKLCARLELAVSSFRADREVLAMQGQYFKDVVESSSEIARKMSYLVEETQEEVFLETHKLAHDALTARIEIEAAKSLAKALIEAARASRRRRRAVATTATTRSLSDCVVGGDATTR